ncbi:MAG: 3-isopropylmalate dehydrogenase [Clostridiales Family XIII bacterium]|jgi:3-isopropylmalate dehydrogenase|nr:3-isopropylmalate dehydrogenase [Clostridiales Family XIII bacterium]
MNFNIAVIKGDGIGPEIVDQAIKALDAVGAAYGHAFKYEELLAGGAAIDETGKALPAHTVDVCKRADAVLLGAVGGWKWDDLPGNERPETALLGLRKALGLFANIRPALLFEELAGACPLRPELTEGGIDLVVVRELTGGIYFGERGVKQTAMGEAAYDVEIYSEGEVKRIGAVAFDMARKRGKKLTSVDKANVLDSSRLWRRVMTSLAADYPDVELSHLYVDNAAMQLIKNPRQFDVIVTSNMFGDILSDEASMITGSLGMLPSASLSASGVGMYEPSHGSVPKMAGLDRANPMATVLSAAMLLRHSLKLDAEANAVEDAVKAVLAEGYRTPDLHTEGKTKVGTSEVGDLIAARVKRG